MLPIKNRLKKGQDFALVFSQGRYASANGLAIKYLQTNRPESRIGFSIGKNYSKKAVERNRARRILRESFRLDIQKIEPGFDVILFIQPHKKNVTAAEAKIATAKILAKAGLVKI